MRRSQRLRERAKRSSRRRSASCRCGPSIRCAELSTRSQLLTCCRLARYSFAMRVRVAASPTFVLAHQQQQREQPFLVPRRLEQPGHGRERCILESAYQLAQLRHANAEKPVARAILARAGLEEALRRARDSGVGKPAQFAVDGVHTKGLRCCFPALTHAAIIRRLPSAACVGSTPGRYSGHNQSGKGEPCSSQF